MEDNVKLKGLAVVGVLIASWILTASVSAQSDFYKGKNITVYVGTTPGALYDQWSRLLAQYMGKHIPGNPVMIVQNMPGAGHMIARIISTTEPSRMV
jgi:tripartite-type tricarboxylate transporter receptor subunit TctC